MEPIQDDIEMIRLCLTADDLAPPPYPGALAALNRLVAERDRLIQALRESEASASRGANLDGCAYCTSVQRFASEALTKTTEED